MEILIDDIPEEGLELSASEKDTWLVETLSGQEAGALKRGGKAKADINIVRCGGNLTIDGILTFASERTCDRCLEEYTEDRDLHVHVVLIPESEVDDIGDINEVELKAEDLEFGYYEGDRIDIGDVIREQVVLADTMKHLCSDNCKGLCHRCGKNLNEGMCKCAEETLDSRWNALKGIKFPSKEPKLHKDKKKKAVKKLKRNK
jgi:uncharacterized protein